MTGSADDRDIAAQLERLFDDPRLDVAPASGATDTVVRGARRVRRRRRVAYVAGGTTAAALVLAAGLTLGLGGSGQTNEAAHPSLTSLTTSMVPPPVTTLTPQRPSWKTPTEHPRTAAKNPTSTVAAPHRQAHHDKPPQASATTSPAAPAPTIAPVDAGTPLGPNGYGRLNLDMSLDDAKKTGMIGDLDTTSSGCAYYKLTTGTESVRRVAFDPNGRLTYFHAEKARSPEHMGVGSTLGDLKKAYPGGKTVTSGDSGRPATYEATISDGKAYRFDLDSADPADQSKVVDFYLYRGENDPNTCMAG